MVVNKYVKIIDTTILADNDLASIGFKEYPTDMQYASK